MKASELLACLERGDLVVTGVPPDRITFLALEGGTLRSYGWGSALCSPLARFEDLLTYPYRFAAIPRISMPGKTWQEQNKATERAANKALNLIGRKKRVDGYHEWVWDYETRGETK
jgi:hypothetical protein